MVAARWRYVYRAKRRHAVLDDSDSAAACGFDAFTPRAWLGAGSIAEQMTLAKLPQCQSCRAALGEIPWPGPAATAKALERRRQMIARFAADLRGGAA